MSNPWTPGPWRLGARKRYRADISGSSPDRDWHRFASVVVRCEGDDEDDKEGWANARLIASAPALVEALEACLGLLTGNMDGDLPADRDPVEMARAALSLAKGTQGETT